MDGNDMNPLLQDWGMIIHPPMLYMGYVGFAVAFAFAIAALLSGKMDVAWARWSRRGPRWPGPSSPSASCSAAGGPIANLAGAAGGSGIPRECLVHALARRHCADSLAGRHREAWRLQGVDRAAGADRLLAVAAGTFLVRSGVLSSVHAFATDPRAAPSSSASSRW